ncbi:FkbM family methyltransferase [Rhodopseudomonas boonkerdii]|jgi:FkbM family methyltransferase|uniref:FkbM family methyltransferase n=1 Tax=Nitrobacteraceae TaxID=41294 RepID=UPI000BCE1047|nr:FkbM family methyltransferase [Rhodopseudomonas boonkerdii]OYU88993.1 MAG: methyltransferase [Bradyrhizobiaceae bacterium PARB1]UGV24645.1 FkbM family methyltransferase [Rhodopseudomonas boonkerdii]
MAFEAEVRTTGRGQADDVLVFDRAADRLTGAGAAERMAFAVLRLGSVLTMPFGHRGYRLGCAVVAGGIKTRDVRVRLNGDAVFSIPFGDGYWSRLLNPAYRYEDEIEMFLREVSDIDYAFVDCGANFGYWSVLVSSRPFGSKQALAIEAAPANMRRLALNYALNGGRFECLHAAIGSSEGLVRIVGDRHEALATEETDTADGSVRRVSLDGLAAAGAIERGRPVVVKLDVEGVEIDALEGARSLMAADALFVCEEHGNDPNHTVSRHLLGSTPLAVHAFDPTAGRFVAVNDPSVLDGIKRHPWVGYNVFATASPMWRDALDRINGRSA